MGLWQKLIVAVAVVCTIMLCLKAELQNSPVLCAMLISFGIVIALWRNSVCWFVSFVKAGLSVRKFINNYFVRIKDKVTLVDVLVAVAFIFVVWPTLNVVRDFVMLLLGLLGCMAVQNMARERPEKIAQVSHTPLLLVIALLLVFLALQEISPQLSVQVSPILLLLITAFLVLCLLVVGFLYRR